VVVAAARLRGVIAQSGTILLISMGQIE